MAIVANMLEVADLDLDDLDIPWGHEDCPFDVMELETVDGTDHPIFTRYF